MEKQLTTKYRWYIRMKTKVGWDTVCKKNGTVWYFDSFEALANMCAKNIDANTTTQFQFIRETYWG